MATRRGKVEPTSRRAGRWPRDRQVGSDQTATALDAHREAAAKAEVYAAHLPEDKADEVVGQAETVGRLARRR
jgi:hypothetical protein